MLAARRCQQLMALVPSLRILKVFSQPWEGDVTMVLPSTYMQIKKSITNPTAEDLRNACRQACPSSKARSAVCLRPRVRFSGWEGSGALR